MPAAIYILWLTITGYTTIFVSTTVFFAVLFLPGTLPLYLLYRLVIRQRNKQRGNKS